MIYFSAQKAAKGHIMPGPCQVNNTWLEPTYFMYPCLKRWWEAESWNCKKWPNIGPDFNILLDKPKHQTFLLVFVINKWTENQQLRNADLFMSLYQKPITCLCACFYFIPFRYIFISLKFIFWMQMSIKLTSSLSAE